MTDKTCQWDKGTVYTGPVACGKPAKAKASGSIMGDDSDEILACGVHARSAPRWYQRVEPLKEENR